MWATHISYICIPCVAALGEGRDGNACIAGEHEIYRSTKDKPIRGKKKTFWVKAFIYRTTAWVEIFQLSICNFKTLIKIVLQLVIIYSQYNFFLIFFFLYPLKRSFRPFVWSERHRLNGDKTTRTLSFFFFLFLRITRYVFEDTMVRFKDTMVRFKDTMVRFKDNMVRFKDNMVRFWG